MRDSWHPVFPTASSSPATYRANELPAQRSYPCLRKAFQSTLFFLQTFFTRAGAEAAADKITAWCTVTPNTAFRLPLLGRHLKKMHCMPLHPSRGALGLVACLCRAQGETKPAVALLRGEGFVLRAHDRG